MTFVWVGSGTMEDAFRRVARMLSGGRVRVIGVRSDVPALLDAADLMVHPARFEGMPLVLLEAMAKGLPIIASSVSGIPEALANAGVLLPSPITCPDFQYQLATALCALAGDSDRRESLGQQARTRALACFTEARMIAEWTDLLGRIVPTV